MERILLILLSLVGFYFSYDFGYLLTGDFGLGQVVGIPFAVILAILSILTILTENKKKKIFRVLTIGYTLSILLFVLIVELIKRNGGTADSYLYYPEGRAYTILLWTLGAGIISMLIVVLRNYKRDRAKGS